MTPASIEMVIEGLKQETRLAFEIDRPADTAGEWWLDLEVDGMPTNVSWQSGRGFGVFTSEPGFGGRPNELYEEPRDAVVRLLQMAAHWRKERKCYALSLREVRQLVGETQSQVAEALATDQARVSRLERPGDMKISTLIGYLSALGGTLEVRARFPAFEAPIDVMRLAGHLDQRRRQHAA
jgi:hypothetical protein